MGTEKEQTTSERDSGLKLGPEWGSHGDSETVQRQQLQSDSLGENSDTRPLLSSRTTNSPAFNEIEKKLACSDFPIHFRRKTRARGKKKTPSRDDQDGHACVVDGQTTERTRHKERSMRDN